MHTLPLLRPARLAALLAAGALGAGAAPAAAEMLTYVDGAPCNVWAENADGSQRRQVTTDADGDHQYSFPSANDAGEYAALLGDRQTGNPALVFLAGSSRTVNLLPAWGLGVTAPLGMRIAPASRLVAYVFGRFHGAGQSIAGNVVPADAPGSPTGPGPGFPRMRSVTWHGDKLVWSSESATFYGTGGGDDGVAQRRHERRGLARRPARACADPRHADAARLPGAEGRADAGRARRDRRRLLRAVHGRAVRRGAVAERRLGRLPRRRRPARRASRDPARRRGDLHADGVAPDLRDRRRPGLLERDADHHPAAARRRRSEAARRPDPARRWLRAAARRRRESAGRPRPTRDRRQKLARDRAEARPDGAAERPAEGPRDGHRQARQDAARHRARCRCRRAAERRCGCVSRRPADAPCAAPAARGSRSRRARRGCA